LISKLEELNALNISLNKAFIHADTQYIEDQDTQVVRKYNILITNVDFAPTHPEYKPQKGDLAIGIDMKMVRDDDDKVIYAKPVIVLRENLLYSYPVQINEWSTRIRLPERVFEDLYTFEDDLSYKAFRLGVNESMIQNENEIIFEGYVRNPVTGKISHFEIKKPNFLECIKELTTLGLGEKLEKDFEDLVHNNNSNWIKVLDYLRESNAFKLEQV
jgi:hypothetical protein